MTTVEAGSLATNEALAETTAAEGAKGAEQAPETGKAGENVSAGKAEEAGKADAAKEGEGKAGEKKDDADSAKAGENADKPKGDGKAKEEGEAKKPEGEGEETLVGAPEKYDDFVLPEGVEFDAEKLVAFQDKAKAMNLSQKGAQELVDMHLHTLNSIAEHQQEQWAETRREWRNATKADTEIGGVKLKANLGYVRNALNAFGNDSFISLMDNFGLGDHVEIVRFLTKVGKAVSEEGLQAGGDASGRGVVGESREAQQAKRLFPTHNKA